jgi:hypothetical protein
MLNMLDKRKRIPLKPNFPNKTTQNGPFSGSTNSPSYLSELITGQTHAGVLQIPCRLHEPYGYRSLRILFVKALLSTVVLKSDWNQ